MYRQVAAADPLKATATSLPNIMLSPLKTAVVTNPLPKVMKVVGLDLGMVVLSLLSPPVVEMGPPSVAVPSSPSMVELGPSVVVPVPSPPSMVEVGPRAAVPSPPSVVEVGPSVAVPSPPSVVEVDPRVAAAVNVNILQCLLKAMNQLVLEFKHKFQPRLMQICNPPLLATSLSTLLEVSKPRVSQTAYLPGIMCLNHLLQERILCLPVVVEEHRGTAHQGSVILPVR